MRINIKNLESYMVTFTIGYCVLGRFLPFVDIFFIKAVLFMWTGVYVIKRFKRIPIVSIAVICFFCVAIIISCFDNSNCHLIQENVLNFNAFFYIFMIPLLFMVENNPEKRLQELYILSYVIVIFLVFVLVSSGMSREQYDYISLGSSVLPYWAIIVQNAFIKRSKLSALVGMVSGVIICLFASRGVGVSVVAILVFYICIYTSVKYKSFVVVGGVFVGILSSYFTSILIWIYEFFLSRGITIRFIYMFLFRNQISAFNMSSGRTEIWQLAIEAIKRKPLTGYGIMGDRKPLSSYASGLYPHNIEIQILMQFGILLGAIIIILLIYVAFNVTKSRSDWKHLFIPYFYSSIFFLQFSSEYYLYVNFWISIMIFCAYMRDKRNRKYGHSINRS